MNHSVDKQYVELIISSITAVYFSCQYNECSINHCQYVIIPSMKHLYKAVIFDLDGTLIDTLGDIASCMNKVLSDRGFPIHEQDKYRIFVGAGLKELVEKALPKGEYTPSLIKECMDDFETLYALRWAELTRPYNGINKLILDIEKKNIPMSVLSNKPHRFTVEMSRHYFGDNSFKIVQGIEEGVIPKPDPSSCIKIAKDIGITPSEFLFLGDSGTDMIAAKSAGMLPIGAGWGFRGEMELKKAGADNIIHHPSELLDFFDIS